LPFRAVNYYPKGLRDGRTGKLTPPAQTIDQQPRVAPQVLVDNSLHTGKTFIESVSVLAEQGFHPTLFVKLIDYQDDSEVFAKEITAVHGMRCASLYTAEELAGCRYRSWGDQLQVLAGYIGLTGFDLRPKLPL
jgi:hypothetical protein